MAIARPTTITPPFSGIGRRRRRTRIEGRAPVGGRGLAFTLVELLVVVGIIGLLIAILLPALARARHTATVATCLSNLRQIGIAIQMYANENSGCIPYGPKAGPVMTATEFYPSTGAPTSLISRTGGRPVGLGLLLQHHLAAQPRVLFCPGADQDVDTQAELEKVGVRQAQGSYFYRHASITLLFDPPPPLPAPRHIRLSSLGQNSNGARIRALVTDTQLKASGTYAPFGVLPRTHHSRRSSGVLYADGSASSVPHVNNAMLVDLDDVTVMTNPFTRILRVFELLDP